MAAKTAGRGDGKPRCFMEGCWNPQHLAATGAEARQDLAMHTALSDRKLRRHCAIDSMKENFVLKRRASSFDLWHQVVAGNEQLKCLPATKHLDANQAGRYHSRVNSVSANSINAA
jgi:hypothetical protein